MTRTVSPSVRLSGHPPLAVGDEFTVRGEGRFRFHSMTETERGCWISAFGGREGRECWRAFTCDRIAVVHRTRVMR